MAARNRRETHSKTAGARRARDDDPITSLALEVPRPSAEPGDDARPAGRSDRVMGAERVYERVAPVVERTVRFYAATDSERDDIAQEALVAILRNRDTVTDPEQLEAWAARVTFNTMCSVFRRRKVRRSQPLESLQGCEPQVPESDFESREILARVLRILKHLPGQERTVLTLELLGNASQEEIAQQTGRSKRTVRRRLKAARQRFMSLAHADPMLRGRVSRDGESGNEGSAGS
ncbi:MAG TPA: sigma-70 family RNA polymerase sigma factor [Polyangiaceae bacterium]